MCIAAFFISHCNKKFIPPTQSWWCRHIVTIALPIVPRSIASRAAATSASRAQARDQLHRRCEELRAGAARARCRR
jgi:hypothetical protein